MPGTPRYLTLDAEQIVRTIEALGHRIEERFPASGLGQVCGELLATARRGRERSEWIARPILPLRIATVVLTVVIVAGLAVTLAAVRPPGRVGVRVVLHVLAAGRQAVVASRGRSLFLVTLRRRA